MSLRDPECLAAMADQRNFRSAATARGVSQPTLSVQLHKLEEGLGAVLIDRAAFRPVLTPTSQWVVGRARAILAEAEAIRVVARDATSVTTQLRLGVFPTLGSYLLPHVLPHSGKRLPNPQLLLTEEETQQLVVMLCSGGLDTALIVIPVGDPHLEVCPLSREEFVLTTPAGHSLIDGTDGSLREGSSIPPARVTEHGLLAPDEGHCLGGRVQRWTSEYRARLRKDYHATSFETMRHMITPGSGLNLLPAMTVLPPVPSAPGLALRRIVPPAPNRDIALVWLRTSPRAATLEALVPTLILSIAPAQGL